MLNTAATAPPNPPPTAAGLATPRLFETSVTTTDPRIEQIMMSRIFFNDSP